MNQRQTITAGAIIGGLAVVIGAFGAHAFKPLLQATGKSDTYELAVRYQFYHALALLVVGILMNQFSSRFLSYASRCFQSGVIFFSGSLYVLCFTGIGLWGAITPIGGALFIAGWILLLLGINKKK